MAAQDLAPGTKTARELHQIARVLISLAKQYNPPQKIKSSLVPDKVRTFASRFDRFEASRSSELDSYNNNFLSKAIRTISTNTSNPDISLRQLRTLAFAEIPDNNPSVILTAIKTIKNPALLGRNPRFLELLEDYIDQIHPPQVIAQIKNNATETLLQQAQEKKHKDQKEESPHGDHRKIQQPAKEKTPEEIEAEKKEFAEKTNEELKKFEEATAKEGGRGKEVKFVEKEHKPVSNPEELQRLEKALHQRELGQKISTEPTPKLIIPAQLVEQTVVPELHLPKIVTKSKIKISAPAIKQNSRSSSTTPSSTTKETAPNYPQEGLPSQDGSYLPAALRNRINQSLTKLIARKTVTKVALPIWLIIIIIIALFIIFVILEQLNKTNALLPGSTCFNQSGGGAGCPDQAALDANSKENVCRYLNPSIDIFNTNISEQAINSYKAKYSGEFVGRALVDGTVGTKDEFDKRVAYVVNSAKTAGINPTIPLGYWKSEQHFSTATGSAPRDLGCAGSTFYEQVDCALGLNNFAPGGPKHSYIPNCTKSRNADSPDCRALRSGRTKNDQTHPIHYPISTFDDWAEAYGPFDDTLGGLHTNCTHTYNILVAVAEEVNMCGGISTNLAAVGGPGNVAACEFYRGDQNPVALPYQSPKLLSYFQEVSSKTGIPSPILAGVARVESTTGSYTISAYTDQDINAIEVELQKPDSILNTNTDSKIAGTNKSMCPTSSTGALGIMQVQPKGTKGHDAQGVAQGAKFAEKEYENLTFLDYCNPKTNIYLGVGVLLNKMKGRGFGDGAHWDPSWNTKENIEKLAESYYGCMKYPSCQNGPYSYGEDLWNSYSNCQGSGLISQTSSACYCSSTKSAVVSCLVPGGTISTASYQANNKEGHCSPGYGLEGRCRNDCLGGISGSRRAKAIDVPTNGKDVVLPTIGGFPARWKLVQQYSVDAADGGGNGLVFEAQVGSDVWTLDMLHMSSTSLQKGQIYPSGILVGKTAIDHVHTTIGKNIKDNLNAGSAVTDCDSGWLPSDFMCGGPNLTSEVAGTSSNTAPIYNDNPGGVNTLIGAPVPKFSIGTASDGKTQITAYQLGAGGTAVAIVGGMNTEESPGVEMVNIAKIEFEAGSTYKIPDGLTVYFIPEITPIGSGGFNANGQDVNRNFDSNIVPGARWSKLGCSLSRYKPFSDVPSGRSCGDSNKTSDIFNTYCSTINSDSLFYCAQKTGSVAFSEPETKAISDFIKSKNIKVVLSYRAPFNNVTNSNAKQKLPGSQDLSQKMANWLGIEYEPYFTNYPVTGQFMDWLQDQNIVGVEIELPKSPNSDNAFRKKNMDAIQNALNWIGGGGGTTTSAGGNCSVEQPVNNFVYYCQSNPQPWGNKKYACSTMAHAGCGPTAMAMVLSTFRPPGSAPKTPDKVADEFTNKRWAVCGQGTAMQSALLDKDWLSSQGLSSGPNIVNSAGAIDLALASKAIQAGQLIIASSDNFPSCNCGHIVVIDNVDAFSGTVDVRDPICSKQNTRVYPAAGEPGRWNWKYAYPVGRV